MDNVRQRINIQTSSCNVCRNQDINVLQSEFLHHCISLRLRKITMKCICCITILHQEICNFLSFHSCSTKDNRILIWICINQSLQSFFFLSVSNHIIFVLDIFLNCIDRSNRNSVRIGQIVFRNTFYFFVHRCREQKSLLSFRRFAKNSFQIIFETH